MGLDFNWVLGEASAAHRLFYSCIVFMLGNGNASRLAHALNDLRAFIGVAFGCLGVVLYCIGGAVIVSES